MPARDGVVLEGLLDPAAGAQQLVFPAALLDAATPQALGRRQIFDLAEQLVDRFVAVRGYADALSLGEKRDDRLRRGVGLAGAGRSLDQQVAPVERKEGTDRSGEGFGAVGNRRGASGTIRPPRPVPAKKHDHSRRTEEQEVGKTG